MKKEKFNTFILLLINSFIILRITKKEYYILANNISWIILSLLLIIFSIYLTIKLKGIQFNIIKIIKSLFQKNNSNNSISNIEALSISMAGKIGVGSLSGIALAINIAGPGVLLWIWISSLILSVLTYAESYLGIIYQDNKNNNVEGGVSYYIRKGLKNHNLSIIYSIIFILAYIIGFLGIQSNTIVKSIHTISNISPITITIITVLITSYIIFNPIKKIVKYTTKLVPLMGLLYISLGLIIILNNIDSVKELFYSIIKEGLNIKTSTISMILIAIQRSIFASETGVGSSAIAAGSTNDNPHNQGLLQVFGVYFTTLIICTITALIILTSSPNIYNGNINGIEILISSFYNNFGNLGSILLCLITCLFAFSTIISCYFYGEKNIYYLNNHNSNSLIMLKILCLIIIILGGLIQSSIIWTIVDNFILLLIIINTYSIFRLKRDIKT